MDGDDCVRYSLMVFGTFVRLLLFNFSMTLQNVAVFFLADDFGVVCWVRTRIVGAATSSIKSNSRF